MVAHTLDAGRSAAMLHRPVDTSVVHVFDFENGVNADADTIEIARVPAGSRIVDVVLYATDLDSGTDVEIDIGLDPAPGGTVADANIIADGLTSFTTAGRTVVATTPTVDTAGEITAGIGIKTHADLDSVVYMTLVDQGDATSGIIVSVVRYTMDASFEADVVDNT